MPKVQIAHKSVCFVKKMTGIRGFRRIKGTKYFRIVDNFFNFVLANPLPNNSGQMEQKAKFG